MSALTITNIRNRINRINIFILVIIFTITSQFSSILSLDNDLHAIVVSTSHTFENFRHSTNSMMFYQYFKKVGIPDHKIILALSEAHTCSPRLKYPGKIYLADGSNKTCHQNLKIDYKETDFHNFRFLDILRGRSSSSQLLTSLRKLNTNRNSRIVIYITSHGGEGFIKVRAKSVILSDDLNSALIEMHSKNRYKEILFILDTCEAFTLFDAVNTKLAPNIFFIGSSIRHEKANSINYDRDFMTPLADRFSFLLLNSIDRILHSGNLNIEIKSVFTKIQQDPLIKTRVAMDYNVKRRILFKDYFGNENFYLNNYYNTPGDDYKSIKKANGNQVLMISDKRSIEEKNYFSISDLKSDTLDTINTVSDSSNFVSNMSVFFSGINNSIIEEYKQFIDSFNNENGYYVVNIILKENKSSVDIDNKTKDNIANSNYNGLYNSNMYYTSVVQFIINSIGFFFILGLVYIGFFW